MSRAVFASLLVVAAPAWATTAIEIAEDGRIPPSFAAGDAPAPVRGTLPLPFAAAPDWQNTLRIQVGGLAFGALNGDAAPDLAVVCYQSQSFPPYDDWRNFVYFNLGAALEANPSWVSADEVHSGDAAIADIDGNGFADLVVANGGSAYAANVIYFRDAAGLATTPGWSGNAPAWATSLEVVDIDSDSDLDVVTSNQGRSQQDAFRPMYLFRNVARALGSVPAWQSAESSIQNSVAAADLDGDLDPDLATAKWVNFESAVYRNDAGTPTATPVWSSGSTGADRGIELADMDRDGKVDLVLGVENTLKILRNTGAMQFSEAWASAQSSSHQDLLVADFNNDGWPDIVDVDFSSGRTYLYLNRNGTPATVPDWSYDAAPVGTALAAADVNHDGWLDLAIGYSGTPSVVVFYNLQPSTDVLLRDGFEG